MAISDDNDIEIGFSLKNFDSLINGIEKAKLKMKELRDSEKGQVNAPNTGLLKNFDELIKHGERIKSINSDIKTLKEGLKSAGKLDIDVSDVEDLTEKLAFANKAINKLATDFKSKLKLASQGNLDFNVFNENKTLQQFQNVEKQLDGLIRKYREAATARGTLNELEAIIPPAPRPQTVAPPPRQPVKDYQSAKNKIDEYAKEIDPQKLTRSHLKSDKEIEGFVAKLIATKSIIAGLDKQIHDLNVASEITGFDEDDRKAKKLIQTVNKLKSSITGVVDEFEKTNQNIPTNALINGLAHVRLEAAKTRDELRGVVEQQQKISDEVTAPPPGQSKRSKKKGEDLDVTSDSNTKLRLKNLQKEYQTVIAQKAESEQAFSKQNADLDLLKNKIVATEKVRSEKGYDDLKIVKKLQILVKPVVFPNLQKQIDDVIENSKVNPSKKKVKLVVEPEASTDKPDDYDYDKDVENAYRKDVNPYTKKKAKGKTSDIRPEDLIKTRFIPSDLGPEKNFEQKAIVEIQRINNALKLEAKQITADSEKFVNEVVEQKRQLLKIISDPNFDTSQLSVDQRKLAARFKKENEKLYGLYDRIEKDFPDAATNPRPIDDNAKKVLDKVAYLNSVSKMDTAERNAAAEKLKKNKFDRVYLEEQDALEGVIGREEKDAAIRQQRYRTTVPDEKAIKEDEKRRERVKLAVKELQKKIAKGQAEPRDLTTSDEYYQSKKSKAYTGNLQEAADRPPIIRGPQDRSAVSGDFDPNYVEPPKLTGFQRYPRKVTKIDKEVEEEANKLKFRSDDLIDKNESARLSSKADDDQFVNDLFKKQVETVQGKNALDNILASGGGSNLPPPPPPPPSNEPPDDDEPKKKKEEAPIGIDRTPIREIETAEVARKNSQDRLNDLRQKAGTGNFSGDDTLKFNTPEGDKLLSLQNRLKTLQEGAIKLAQPGALPGFKDGEEDARKLALSIHDINQEIKTLDVLIAQRAGSGKSTLVKDKLDAEKLDNEVKKLIRDFKELQDYQNLSKVVGLNNLSPSQTENLGYNNKEITDVVKGRGQALALTKDFDRTKKDASALGPVIEKTFNDASKSVKNAETQLEEIQKQLLETKDSNSIEKLTQDTKLWIAELQKAKSDLIGIKSAATSIPKISQDKQATRDEELKRIRALRTNVTTDFGQFERLGRQSNASKIGIAQDAKEGADELKRLLKEIKRIEDALSAKPDDELFKTLIRDAEKARSEFAKTKRSLDNIKQIAVENPAPRKTTPIIQQVAQGFSVPFASRLPAAFAVGFSIAAMERFITVSYQVLERAGEVIKANRLLASSALEAGLGYDSLVEKNKEFSRLAGLSQRQGGEVFAKVAQLAGRAQAPETIDSLGKRFLDLGAARGLDTIELKSVIQQILSGQDEGYKKLGLRAPGQVYDEEARKTGRNAADLTSVEKTQLFVRDFEKKADIFKGAAEARLNSVDGKTSKLVANLNNLGDVFSLLIASSYEVQTGIEFLSKSIGNLLPETKNLAGKVERGENIEENIKKQATPNQFVQLGNGFLGLGGVFAGILGSLGAALTTPTGKDYVGPGVAQTGFGLLLDETEGFGLQRREDEVRRQVNSEILSRSIQRKATDDRNVELVTTEAEEQQTRDRLKEEKRFSKLFSRARATPDEIGIAISTIQKNDTPFQKRLDENALQTEVDLRLKKEIEAKPQDKRYLEFTDQTQIRRLLEDQARKEFEASLKVQNSPLFDPETQQRLIEQGQQDLSNAVKKTYDRVLADPELKVEQMFTALGEVKKDTRLFPEVQEALENQITEKIKATTKTIEGLLKTLHESFTSSIGSTTSNPFSKLLDDAAYSADEFAKSLAPLGPELQAIGRAAKQAEADYAVTKQRADSELTALKFQQEARKLQRLPETQTNSFGRRFETIGANVNFVQTEEQLRNSALRNSFFGQTDVRGKSDKIRLDRLRKQYSQEEFAELRRGAKGSREEKLGYIESSESIRRSQEVVSKFQGISRQGLGLRGEEAIANAIVSAIPSDDVLFSKFKGGGKNRVVAQDLFGQKADAEETLRKVNKKKFDDFLENQKFLDLNIKDAEESAKKLTGLGLNKKDEQDKFLSITGELGNAELSPELRQKRIEVLGARAITELSQEKEAAAQQKEFNDLINEVKSQMKTTGLKVDIGNAAVIDLVINADGVSAVLNTRPNAGRER